MKYNYGLIIVIVLGVIVRYMHLISGDHYYLLGPDSYYFDHQAYLLSNGHHISIMKSVLVYPVAYLPGATYWLPIALYLIGAVLLYYFVKYLWGRWAALYSVLCWALIPEIVLISSAGWIDRDALMGILISAIGAIYVVWEQRLWGPIVIVIISWVVAILWVPFSAWIIAGLMSAILIAKMVAYGTWRLPKLPYITYGITIATTVTITAILHSFSGTTGLLTKHGPTVTGFAETDTINIVSIVTCYGYFLPIIVIAVYQALKSKGVIQVQLAMWLCAVFLVSLLAQRLILFGILPATVLSGLLIYRVYKAINDADIIHGTKQRLMAILSGALWVVMIGSVMQSLWVGNIRGISPDNNWQDALSWLKGREQCTIASHWNYQSWIMDLTKQDTTSCDNYYCPGADYVIMPADVKNKPDLPIVYENEGVIVYADNSDR